MYLFQCFEFKDFNKNFKNKNGYEVDWGSSVLGEGINSYLIFEDERGAGFQLSEFPGNCSALVLSNIENKEKEDRRKILDLCIEFCKEFKYALLFVSGTNQEVKKFWIEKGFKAVLDNIYNHHSGHENYFLVLEV